jgi:hypothetical protein
MTLRERSERSGLVQWASARSANDQATPVDWTNLPPGLAEEVVAVVDHVPDLAAVSAGREEPLPGDRGGSGVGVDADLGVHEPDERERLEDALARVSPITLAPYTDVVAGIVPALADWTDSRLAAATLLCGEAVTRTSSAATEHLDAFADLATDDDPSVRVQALSGLAVLADDSPDAIPDHASNVIARLTDHDP